MREAPLEEGWRAALSALVAYPVGSVAGGKEGEEFIKGAACGGKEKVAKNLSHNIRNSRNILNSTISNSTATDS